MKKLFLALLLVAACGGNVKDQPLTGESWEALKDSRDLTTQEIQYLNAYIMSQGMRSATDQEQPEPFSAGLTIGEAIAQGQARVEGMSKALDDVKKQ